MNPIEQNAAKILKVIIESKKEQIDSHWFEQNLSDLAPQDVDDAVNYLDELGAIKLYRALGTAPYRFAFVFVQSRGRYIYHETFSKTESSTPIPLPERPFNPIGSPYGFSDTDWEEVALHKRKKDVLYVVLGMKFESPTYNTESFRQNLKSHLDRIVAQYNRAEKTIITLNYKPLSMGLGEHLFNEIARDIIGADIAFFETSDLAPNVMLEFGVALTWGVRVIPIKEKNHPKPPTDVSGQSWVDHENSCEKIITAEFDEKMLVAIKRALGVKGR